MVIETITRSAFFIVMTQHFRVVVKGGVWPFDSGGDLVGIHHLDSIFNYDARNHIGQVVKSV